MHVLPARELNDTVDWSDELFVSVKVWEGLCCVLNLNLSRTCRGRPHSGKTKEVGVKKECNGRVRGCMGLASFWRQ